MLLDEITNSISSGKNKERVVKGKYPVYGSTGEISRTNTAIYFKPQILIARVGANAGFVNLVDGSYDVSDNTLIVDVKESVNIKYMYYILQNMNLNKYAKGGGQPLITAGQLKEIKVPVPEIEIQSKIVNVLDNFDSICSDLNIGLPAEIEARQKQYEFYRDCLLTYAATGEIILEEKRREEKRAIIRLIQYVFGYVNIKIGDICKEISNVKWKTEENYEYIDLSSVDRKLNLIVETTMINKNNAPDRAKQIVKNKDVLFGTTRPMLKRICMINEKYDNQICSTGFCVLRVNDSEVLPEYLYFNIQTEKFYNYIEQNQKGASYPAIGDNEVKNYKILLPTLKEQEEIVKTLLNFEKLTNDIEEGLPAEIEARQKQYEYYRDKLLNFKEMR